MLKVKKVRIVKCDGNHWYKNAIGISYDIYEEGFDQYLVYKDGNGIEYGILKSDCEVIEEEKCKCLPGGDFCDKHMRKYAYPNKRIAVTCDECDEQLITYWLKDTFYVLTHDCSKPEEKMWAVNECGMGIINSIKEVCSLSSSLHMIDIDRLVTLLLEEIEPIEKE